MSLREIYNEFNNRISLSKELGILVDFELYFGKSGQIDVAFVFDEKEDFSLLMKALAELEVLQKDIIVNSYNLLSAADKFYSESILIRTTKEIAEIEAVFRKYRSVEPYSVEKFREDEEYKESEIIWWFRANGEVINFKKDASLVDNIICLYFE